ncbi:MAG: hypothetical protein KDJ41_18260 [Hyphomicrobiaceae bacterium]|nr:hypothetical protein [Hyphomicrobiaceae bacterium]
MREPRLGTAHTDEAIYREIEAALLETPRGAWFLAEFARRTLAAEAARTAESLLRLERAVLGQSAPPYLQDVARQLEDLRRLLMSADSKLRMLSGTQNGADWLALNGVLESAARVHEGATLLAQAGADPAITEAIAEDAQRIYRQLAGHAVEAERARHIAEMLSSAQARISRIRRTLDGRGDEQTGAA